MSATVAFTIEHVQAVEHGLRALEGETELLQRLRMVSPEHERSIARLEDLRDRMREGREERLPVMRRADLAVVR